MMVSHQPWSLSLARYYVAYPVDFLLVLRVYIKHIAGALVVRPCLALQRVCVCVCAIIVNGTIAATWLLYQEASLPLSKSPWVT